MDLKRRIPLSYSHKFFEIHEFKLLNWYAYASQIYIYFRYYKKNFSPARDVSLEMIFNIVQLPAFQMLKKLPHQQSPNSSDMVVKSVQINYNNE